MNKSDAIRIFGSSAELARALNLSRGRISQLPEDLEQRDIDRIVGAAIRLGLYGDIQSLGKIEKTKAA
jgi:transcriptional regulator with XRE-family HTH domain